MTQQVDVPSEIIHTNEKGMNNIYIIHEKIGQGGFSVVHRATDKNTNQQYAIKIIPKERYSNNRKILYKLKNEIRIQKDLNHPNIVKSTASFSDERNQYMILEYCPGKSICDYLKKVQKDYLNESETIKIIKDVLRGLLYLHNNKIIHHDLKLENFLIGADGRVKIADFGVSTVLKNLDDKNYSLCGTTNYMSPELLQEENNGHGFEVDIWAIGVATFILLTGQYPFGGFENDFIYEKVKKCDFCFPQNIQLSNEAVNFIKSIFIVDPLERPKVIDLLKHPFMAKYDIEKVRLFDSNYNNANISSFSPASSLYNGLTSLNSNKPAISNDLNVVHKKFDYQKVSHRNENSQLNDLNYDLQKNFIIPNHFVIKHLFYYEDLGYLLGDGTVGVCFHDNSRMVIDPNEKFIQYYQNYNSKEEVIKLNEQFIYNQRDKFHQKFSIVQNFSKSFKKFGFSYNSTSINYDPKIPLYHVKYFVVKNDSILFKLNSRDIQMNCSDHKKLIIFYDSKKMCLVNYLKERCSLLNLNDVAKNKNCEEYIKLKESKELAHSISQKI